MTTSLPRVSVLVLKPTGRRLLNRCLSSLRAQTYPKDRFQIDVVDARARGVSGAYNDAVRRCGADFVALLGNDARVDQQWLAELVSAAERHRASAVASKILDWTGKTTDFAGDALSFIGHPSPLDAGAAAARADGDERLLFPCGGSALFSRAVFLEAGGFDEGFVDGLEDVDLGWRLNVLGHTIVLASQAVTYRRPQAAASPWEQTRRLRLLERNALATIYKNYEASTLERVFPVAVALSLMKGLTRSGIDRLTLNVSSRPSEVIDVTPNLVAHLIALEDFCRHLPALKRQREFIQKRRRRPDAELWALFGDPLRLRQVDALYVEVARTLIRDFGIDEIVKPPHKMPAQRAVARDPAAAVAQPQATTAWPAPLPKISIVILTALGATHVCECLTSLAQQTYPREKVEVIVVDNGSADDPTAAVQQSYPGARVIRNNTNIGFAAGNNVGASAATGDCLVFLNDDTRVDPNWLLELVRTAQRRHAAAVASFILDWSGERIDFVGAAMNFQGKGFQLNYDTPTKSLTVEEKPLLFPCGCAMLIDRDVFMDVGRWDEGTFAYYEDVELGWRLNLLGHAVWFSPGAVVYHKHHGTSGLWPEPPRTRLYERNSLRMLYELLERRSLARALPATLLLAADRALLNTSLSRATDVPAESTVQAARRRLTPKQVLYSTKAALVERGINRRTPISEALTRLGVRGLLSVARKVLAPPRVKVTCERRAAYLVERGTMPARFDEVQSESLPIEAAAILLGIYGFLADIPALTKRRADVQRRRRTTDLEIIRRFGSHWRQHCRARFQREHDDFQAMLIDEFAIAAVGL